LYAILGWSSFVGMAVMIALIPVPAWAATLMQSLQEVKMQAVSTLAMLQPYINHSSTLD
jgi:hypothetical protein